ncbi:MAG: hypothetical protein K2J25_00545, partial [Oscillospiraceae bacterium]|nr:hypothetical protein [Oscillospiraceae bacterium]
MEFKVISQSFDSTSVTHENRISLIKLDTRLPMNWMGNYVYMDNVPIKTTMPHTFGEYDLILHYSDDIIGKTLVIAESDMDYNIDRFNSNEFMLPVRNDDIKLYKLNKQHKFSRDSNLKYVFLADVSLRKFYDKTWMKAIKAEKIKIFKANSKVSITKSEKVFHELQSILTWCEKTYGKKSLEYFRMSMHISEVVSKIERIIEAESHIKTILY